LPVDVAHRFDDTDNFAGPPMSEIEVPGSRSGADLQIPSYVLRGRVSDGGAQVPTNLDVPTLRRRGIAVLTRLR